MSKHRPKPNPGHTVNTAHPSIQPVSASHHPTEPQGLKRRHFMGTALALDAAALLAACGGGGGGDSGGTGMSGSGSGSGSASSSASSSGSASSSAASSASSSASSSGSSGSSGSSSASSSGSGSGLGSGSNMCSGSSSGSGSGSAKPTNWVVSTFAGTGSNGPRIDGTGGTATFYGPAGIAVDTCGYLYVADSFFYSIRKITPGGVVSTLAGSGWAGAVNGTAGTATFDSPGGVAMDTSGHLFVIENTNADLRKVTPAGVVSTLAGVTGLYGYLDGTGTVAQFNGPRGVAIDVSGNLFVAETTNQRIRKVTPAGVVSTLAGTGASGSADGFGTLASFKNPFSVAVDAIGVVYVADSSNHLIRKITPEGVVTTLAGTGTAGAVNGTGTNASFHYPRGLAIDAGGAVYVADYGNHLIRKITPEGVVSILAGTGTIGATNGTGTLAGFNQPSGITFDGSGNLWVADTGNNRIRKITPIY